MLFDFDANNECTQQSAYVFHVARFEHFPRMIAEILDDVKRHVSFRLGK